MTCVADILATQALSPRSQSATRDAECTYRLYVGSEAEDSNIVPTSRQIRQPYDGPRAGIFCTQIC